MHTSLRPKSKQEAEAEGVGINIEYKLLMMKKFLLLLLSGILYPPASKAATTTKDVERDMVNYTLVTVTESGSWAKARTRGVREVVGDKVTRYAVVKSGAANALGSIEIKDTIIDEGNSYAVMAVSSHAFENMYLIKQQRI